jgi:hypothetical protein
MGAAVAGPSCWAGTMLAIARLFTEPVSLSFFLPLCVSRSGEARAHAISPDAGTVDREGSRGGHFTLSCITSLTLLEWACRSTVSHRFDILKRRQSKKPPVFSAKLRRTVIANFQSSSGCIQRTAQHEPSCFLKAEVLLIL